MAGAGDEDGDLGEGRARCWSHNMGHFRGEETREIMQMDRCLTG